MGSIRSYESAGSIQVWWRAKLEKVFLVANLGIGPPCIQELKALFNLALSQKGSDPLEGMQNP